MPEPTQARAQSQGGSMKIKVRLRDADGKEGKRQYTLQQAMDLIKSYLKQGRTTIIIRSDDSGGKVWLRRDHN